MAATAYTSQRTVKYTILLALAFWSIGIAGLVVRWNASPFPPPPAYAAFPYGEIRVGVDPSYPPFGMDDGTKVYGFEIDLGRAIAEQIGMPVRFVNLGFDGLYDALRTDRADVILAGLMIDPARMREARYARPYFNNGLLLVSPEEHPVPSMEAAAGLQISTEFGSEADAELRRWQRRIAGIVTLPYEIPDYALDALRLGLSDGAVVDTATFLLYRRAYPDWQVSSTWITTIPLAPALRIDRLGAWELVQRALEALEANGQLAEIRERWF